MRKNTFRSSITAKEQREGSEEVNRVEQRDDHQEMQGGRQRRKPKYFPLDTAIGNLESTQTKFYVFKFAGETRLCVNPYEFIDKVKEVTGIQLKRIFGNNQASMTVEVDKELSEEQIGKLTRIDDMACK